MSRVRLAHVMVSEFKKQKLTVAENGTQIIMDIHRKLFPPTSWTTKQMAEVKIRLELEEADNFGDDEYELYLKQVELKDTVMFVVYNSLASLCTHYNSIL